VVLMQSTVAPPGTRGGYQLKMSQTYQPSTYCIIHRSTQFVTVLRGCAAIWSISNHQIDQFQSKSNTGHNRWSSICPVSNSLPDKPCVKK